MFNNTVKYCDDDISKHKYINGATLRCVNMGFIPLLHLCMHVSLKNLKSKY